MDYAKIEEQAREELDKAVKALADYRGSAPVFTPVPDYLHERLDAARIAHDKAYDAWDKQRYPHTYADMEGTSVMSQDTPKTKDMVQQFQSNTRKMEYNFFPAVIYALEQFENKNNKPLYRLFAFVNGKKVKGVKGIFNADGDDNLKAQQFVAPLKRVIAKALPGVTFIFKDGKCKVRVTENGGLNHDVLMEMQECLATWRNVSVRSEAFKSMFPAVKPVKKELTKLQQKEKIDAALKRLADSLDITEQAVIALMQASKKDLETQERNSDEGIAH